LAKALEECFRLKNPCQINLNAINPQELDYMLENLCGGDPLIMKDMVEFFISESEKLITDINSAIERGDCQNLCYTAHSLKSSSASFGAIQVSRLCKEIEEMGRTENLGESKEKAIALTHAFECFKRFLVQRFSLNEPQ
jgi:HPt (histidine-containing phosphotransfer) domain-containing protein